ncbi:NADPH:quinone reductase [Sulfitobacter aestuariivivens]|uniref:NADPH:quinone reductase n=1 Tax=Sulfitobacter aestuariivivens TaxID=2766981 RepID=A0A927D794_9RHOB|nr:NADPH:quinone reductase [Sulfitobacter aestuariivivens]MBD3664081.1 NADPH:quinone reductase [Sulfitobacter aestuariivivens]
MRAITYSVFGPARDVLELHDVALAEPQAGEVRVRLAFSGVNPSDVKARAGTRPGVIKPAFPTIIPHSDGAGVIEAVGAGIDQERVGQRVWIWNGQWQRPFGTAAQAITLPAHQAVPLPNDISLETGAILGIPGLTACHAVFGGGAVAGESVLIQGGAGTVGMLAVQLAKWGGARVIATCSERDHDRVVRAGADTVLPYGTQDLANAVVDANEGHPIDTIVEVEFGHNIAVDADIVAPNGRIAVYGSAKEMNPTVPFGPLLFKAVNIDVLLIYLLQAGPREQAVTRLHDALREGALDCPVQQIVALSETPAAHEAVEAGGRTGAVLIDCQA